jgi:Flp pilus assembly protein TadG
MNPFRSRFDRFVHDTRGVSAIEFALILPVLVLFVAGTVDVNEGLTVHRKIRQISATVSDLVAQSDNLSQDEVATILAGAAKILEPYPAAKLLIIVSVLDVTGKKRKVVWSLGHNTAALAKDAVVDVPDSITANNVQLVRAEVKYSFSTMFSALLRPVIGADGYSMGDVMYNRPRVSEQIKLQG